MRPAGTMMGRRRERVERGRRRSARAGNTKRPPGSSNLASSIRNPSSQPAENVAAVATCMQSC